MNRQPLDLETQRRPLEICEPHNLDVQNLKKKMQINPHATVIPFLIMVDPEHCESINDCDISNPEKYQCFVTGESTCYHIYQLLHKINQTQLKQHNEPRCHQ